MLPLAFIPSLGGPELLIVGGVVLLIFGNRLPSVMRSLGKSVVEFKKGISGTDEEETPAAPLNTTTTPTPPPPPTA